MHCIETSAPASAHRAAWGAVFVLSALVAGCANQAPAPAAAPVVANPVSPRPLSAPAPGRPASPAPAPAPAPAPVAVTVVPSAASIQGPVPDLGPKVAQPPAPRASNWNEFKRMAARRMVAGSPKISYMGKPPPMLYAIPVLEVELNADGTVRGISVTRAPAKDDAQDTIDIARAVIYRGEPYGDMSRLPKPWKFTEVFLFNDQRKFKPRTLD